MGCEKCEEKMGIVETFFFEHLGISVKRDNSKPFLNIKPQNLFYVTEITWSLLLFSIILVSLPCLMVFCGCSYNEVKYTQIYSKYQMLVT